MEFTKNNSPKHCTILWANHSKTFPIQVMYGHFRTPWSLLNPEMRRQSHPTELPFSPLISPSIKLRCFGQRKFHQPMCINHIQHVKTLDQHTNPAQMWKQFPPKKSHPSSSSNPLINIFIFQPHCLPSPTPPRTCRKLHKSWTISPAVSISSVRMVMSPACLGDTHQVGGFFGCWYDVGNLKQNKDPSCYIYIYTYTHVCIIQILYWNLYYEFWFKLMSKNVVSWIRFRVI